MTITKFLGLKKSTTLVVGVALLGSLAWSATPALAAPAAPVITTLSQATSTNPIMLSGTADANISVVVTGGVGTSTASSTASGTWDVSVDLMADILNSLSVVAVDGSGDISTAAMIDITHSSSTSTSTSTPPTATSSPIITLSGEVNMGIFGCNGFTEPGFSAVDSTGASITATSTGTVEIDSPGTYTIVYTATDAEGHTASTTRTVTVRNCSSGGGGGGGSSGDSNRPFTVINPSTSNIVPPGPPIATPPVQFVPTIFGGFIPPGQVLGLSSNVSLLFASNLSFGSRGAEVMALQTRLSEMGYFQGPITGYYGPITRAAVRAFQRAHGVSATGNVGPMTRAVLNS